MSILINKDTRVVVQGITGKEGTFHATQCMEYGTNVVAGVTPGKGGLKWENKVPVYNTVAEAVEKEGANAALIFVPPAFCADAIAEAVDAGVGVIVTISEGIPALDMLKVKRSMKGKDVRMVGPNCPCLLYTSDAADE